MAKDFKSDGRFENRFQSPPTDRAARGGDLRAQRVRRPKSFREHLSGGNLFPGRA